MATKQRGEIRKAVSGQLGSMEKVDYLISVSLSNRERARGQSNQ